VAAAVLVASLGTSARALERVTLSTGDVIPNCTHHEAVDANHIRLHLFSTDPNADNYQDLPTGMIVGFETVPDPPPVAAPAKAAPLPSPVSYDIHDLIASAGAQHNIDVELLASIVHTESAGASRAVSRAGARGLMQLMPATARDLGVEDPFRPDQNIAGGAAYLDSLLTRYKNDLSRALAAYNAGPAAVDRYHGIPPYPETRAYVARVEKEFTRRKQAAARTAVQASVVAH
jgi:soluble lytic murein transglycosylase-like protein